MSLSNDAENKMGLLIFNNTNYANIGDATGLRGSTTAGVFYLRLHTADPGEGGAQNTNEIAYTGYAAVAVARSTAGFTVTADTVTLFANAVFGEMTGGAGGTATHFTVGTDATGAGTLWGIGTLTPNIAITSGVIPIVKTTTNIVFA
jgi:hypothetical protein